LLDRTLPENMISHQAFWSVEAAGDAGFEVGSTHLLGLICFRRVFCWQENRWLFNKHPLHVK
jgi:hypothetical protein